MAIASILLGIASFLFMIGGFTMTGVPIVGSVFSFGGPLLALAGIITGGIAMKQSKQMNGETSGVAIAGLVVSIVGFVLSFLVAMTCGLCNACLSTATVNGASGARGTVNQGGAALGRAFGQAMQDGADRTWLTEALSGIQSGCHADASGSSTSSFFHPQVFPGVQASVCSQVTASVVDGFRRCVSIRDCEGPIPTNAEDDALTAQLSAPSPIGCVAYQWGEARITVCDVPGSGRQIVRLVNLTSIP